MNAGDGGASLRKLGVMGLFLAGPLACHGCSGEDVGADAVANRDVAIDGRACRLVVGKARPEDVIDLYGWPITRGWNGATAIGSMVYMHRDSFSPVPEIVHFMFRRQSDRKPELLIGAIRTTGPGPYGFSCFRDIEGNEVPPLALAP
jgi:hypothetical protein